MEHARYKELLILALYNEISPADRAHLDEHLQGCEECRREKAEINKLQLLYMELPAMENEESFLTEARLELQAEIRKLRRKKGLFSRFFGALAVPTAASLRFAYGTAAMAMLLFAGSLVFLFRTAPNGAPGASAIPVNDSGIAAKVMNLKFLRSDLAQGEVEVSYQAVTPVTVKGRVDDPAIQRLLAQSLLDNSNPGVRLKAVSALTTERTTVHGATVKSALLHAMQCEENPGVRKEALRAAGKLPFDDDIRNALLNVLSYDEDAGLRILAINTLAKEGNLKKIADPKTMRILREKEREDNNTYIQLQAKALLTKLQS